MQLRCLDGRISLCKATSSADFKLRNTTGQHMSTFDKREEGFESKFAHDEELRFKARARRNKLGMTGAAAETYAVSIVAADLDKPNSDSVFGTLRKDFDEKGVAQSDHQIRRTMD